MSKIAEFLTHFDDQHLANLQCAAEDGTLVYRSCTNCLLHHFNGEYSITKWEGELAPLARLAEGEFLDLGPFEADVRVGFPVLVTTDQGDPMRRQAILPLIQAEWARRGARPIDIIQTGSVDFGWTIENGVLK